MYPCCKWHRQDVPFSFLEFATLLLCVVCTPGMGIAQDQLGYLASGVTSDTFLREIPAGNLPTEKAIPTFPPGVDLASGATKASFSPKFPKQSTESVSTAQFEASSTATRPNGSTIGSGVAFQPPNPAVAMSATPSMPLESKTLGWKDRFRLDRSLPNFLVGYESIGFRRGSDSIGPYSLGSELPRFEQEITGRYTISRLLGSLERIEFKFTGPLHWDRTSSAMGLVDSQLPQSLQSWFNGADSHQQSHRIRLSSYELNRCWTGDELSKIFGGLRLLDHEEQYRLESTKGINSSNFRLKTDNFMVGGQIGLNLFRPVSQRLTAGFGTSMGLFGNFASGSFNAVDGATTLVESRESGLRINSLFEWSGLVSYRVSPNIDASCGYEWWYFPGLATVANQRLSDSSQGSQFSLRTGDDQLFRGWTAGLSMRF